MSREADEVERSLRELEALSARTRLASRSGVTGLPMVGWGFTWIVGVPAVELLDGLPRILVCGCAWLIGMLTSWWPMSGAIRTGLETPLRRAWLVVFVATPFLLLAARPESFTYGMLLVGGLWGVAMCLYGVATQDGLFALVTGFGVVVAGMTSLLVTSHPLTPYGVIAGLPLVALGATRMWRGARRA